ncbi:hypothetical protein KCU65_g2690, partial [Aureobasidium melanogenum]
MGGTSTMTNRSAPDSSHIPPHIRAYDYLVVRATDFLAANDVASSQRVARLLLRSRDLSRAHKLTCHRILSHHGSENRVYRTAQALEMWSYKPGAAKIVDVSSPITTPRPAPRTTPIKKDDAWIVHSPAKTPTRAVKKRVTFADEVDVDEEIEVKKRDVRVSKVGKLFPELRAKFEIVE